MIQNNVNRGTDEFDEFIPKIHGLANPDLLTQWADLTHNENLIVNREVYEGTVYNAEAYFFLYFGSNDNLIGTKVYRRERSEVWTKGKSGISSCRYEAKRWDKDHEFFRTDENLKPYEMDGFIPPAIKRDYTRQEFEAEGDYMTKHHRRTREEVEVQKAKTEYYRMKKQMTNQQCKEA